MPFDIEAFLKFNPARYHCQKCLALWKDPHGGCEFNRDARFMKCRVCGVRYIPAEGYSVYRIGEYLSREAAQPLSGVKDIISHGTGLATISSTFKRARADYPPFRSLLQAFLHARSFIHFTSWGISQVTLGALKLAAQYVPVRGIVSGNIGENTISEVTDYKDEAPDLMIHFWKHSDFRSIEEPHQKLIVVDGLLAFKGSGNLSQTSWRSAANGMEMIEVVTDVDEVVSLHNRFFSPLWSKVSDIGE